MARLTYAGRSGFWRDDTGALLFCGTIFSQASRLYRVPPEQIRPSFARAARLDFLQQFLVEPALVLVYAAAESETPFWVLLVAYVLLGRPALQWALLLRKLEPTLLPAPLETRVEPVSRGAVYRAVLSMALAALIVIFLSNPAHPPSFDTLWPNLLALGGLGLVLAAERRHYQRKLADSAA